MRGNALLAIMATLFILITGCGKKAVEVFSAPESQYQAGIIASCTTDSEAWAVAEKLGGQFRVLNEKKKLIEFRGIDAETLKEHLPKAKFLKNKFYGSLVEGPSQVDANFVPDYEFKKRATPVIYRSEGSANNYYFKHLDQIEAANLPSHIMGQGVVIAVVDTGVDYNHSQLNPNIYLKNGNMIGKNFVNGNNPPMDDHGHGTHVAGLAAGTLYGVAPKAKIMPIKVLNSNGQGDIASIAAGILYALENGADIINLSLGGASSQMAQRDINALLSGVTRAESKGKLLVAAAGNGGNDGLGDCNDEAPVYPSSFQSDSLIAVAAVNSFNSLAFYSNYGGATVHISAPGGNGGSEGLCSIALSYSYGTGGNCLDGYASMSGTSMATPLVSGLAALIKSANNNLSSKQIREIIFNTGRTFSALQGITKTGKVINVANAINSL